MRKLNRKIVLFTIVTYYNWCENVICCFVLHTDRPKNFTLDLCCKALHRVHRPNNSSRAVFQRIPPPQSLIPFISFLYLLFFIVKQLDQGNRFTNWIRSLVEITRYSHTHTHKFTLLSSSRVSIEIFRQIRFSSSSYQFTHSRRKAKRPSHFSRFEIVFSASLFKTVTRNFDRGREFVSMLTGWEEVAVRVYALCKCKCQCHQSEIRLTRSVKVNQAWWEPRFVRSVYDSW